MISTALTNEARSEVRRQYKAGQSQREIAKALGLHPSTVQRACTDIVPDEERIRAQVRSLHDAGREEREALQKEREVSEIVLMEMRLANASFQELVRGFLDTYREKVADLKTFVPTLVDAFTKAIDIQMKNIKKVGSDAERALSEVKALLDDLKKKQDDLKRDLDYTKAFAKELRDKIREMK